ncbi:hypothetical protein [Methylotenera sp.]|uniref:hypothetical protein n=1 Tax=Methylotenera sp. TaxID=2051956 RepID=UPI0027350516|nr:hypothetical protein [Methylotenera sp.]MDP3308273.1 hypothetical protein [Methylotenera sp.]
MSGMTQDELEMSEEISTLLHINTVLSNTLDDIAAVLEDSKAERPEYEMESDGRTLDKIFDIMDKFAKDETI